jgi:hypothetical protein
MGTVWKQVSIRHLPTGHEACMKLEVRQSFEPSTTSPCMVSSICIFSAENYDGSISLVLLGACRDLQKQKQQNAARVDVY